jgi:hypothetical protein
LAIPFPCKRANFSSASFRSRENRDSAKDLICGQATFEEEVFKRFIVHHVQDEHAQIALYEQVRAAYLPK